MSLLFAGCPIHKGEISVEEKCFNCEYFLGKQFLFYTVDRWCSHPEIANRLDKIRKKVDIKSMNIKIKIYVVNYRDMITNTMAMSQNAFYNMKEAINYLTKEKGLVDDGNGIYISVGGYYYINEVELISEYKSLIDELVT